MTFCLVDLSLVEPPSQLARAVQAARTDGVVSAAVRICWWNAGLSPPNAREVPSRQRYTLARQVIRKLLRSHEIDVLCLGEVSEDDLAEIAPSSNLASSWHTQARELAVVYSAAVQPPTRLKEHIQTFQRRTSLTTGVHLQVVHVGTGSAIHLMLAHWPSRIVREQDRDRHEAARLLREHIASLGVENVVVAGDFNDEPFDESLTSGLLAYRERQWVREAPGTALYNPFWRVLGELHPLEREGRRGRPAGTCAYAGRTSQWAVYDQILFGRAFLGGGPFTLVEDEVEVWCRAPLYRRTGIARHFDHLPVMATLSTRSVT